MTATVINLPAPRPRFEHFCWPYAANGVIRAGCTQHFGQELSPTAITPKAGAR